MKNLLILLAVLGTVPAYAQTHMHREVPTGEVTGLEMGIEGALQVPVGGRLRWFVTVYEVVHGRTLRPAASATLSAQASFHRKDPVATATTDENGHAELAFDIPESEPTKGSFELAVKVRAKQVMRQFDVAVERAPRYRTEIEVDRQVFEPGEPVYVWGRLIDTTRERPVAGHEVRIEASSPDHKLSGGDVSMKTDAAGFYHASLRAPAEEGVKFSIVVHPDVVATDGKRTGLTTARVKIPVLVVKCAPERAVVAPGTEVQVNVVVRTPDGRPVPRATVTGIAMPRSNEKKPAPPILTDENGRARVPWKVSASEAVAEVTAEVHAVREGFGTGFGKVQVRVTRRTHTLAWAVEGNTLIPGLPGQLFVRLHQPDGQPIVGAALRLAGARFTPATARTDAEGTAMLETTLGAVGAAASPGCTGDTVAAATLQVGEESDELCLPVDPDATVRVRVPPLLEAGRPVEVRLQRGAAVAQAPIAVALLTSPEPDRWRPVAETIVAGASSRAVLTVPAEAVGRLWVRARPLLGPLRSEIRGGSTLAWSAPGPAPRLRVSTGKGEALVTLDGASAPASGLVLALPVEVGQRLLDRLNGPLPTQGRSASSNQLRGYLAAQTPTDDVVSASLRDGTVTPLPAPADPVMQGRLRDPRRAQERFVRGRLARILNALERRIEQSIPKNLDEVAFQSPQGWRWNREVLNLLLPELKAEGLVGLDGNPLTIEALQALDPTITYDNAARRITREHLFQLYVSLEHFIKEKNLGYGWARRGDPSGWLLGLIDRNDGAEQSAIKAENLFDAWGHPFVLQRSRDGRNRFHFLAPIPGWEIVSAGPDGRLNTADDLADPFARVLGSGTIYAQAAGEELLLARLNQVELGRATVAALGEVFELKATEPAEADPDAPRSSWLEPPVAPDDAADGLVPAVIGPEPGTGAFSQLAPVTRVPLVLATAPRNYLVVAGAYGKDGAVAFGAQRFAGGVPLLLDVAAPERLRPHESVRVPIVLTYLGTPQQIRIAAVASGSIAASTDAAASKLQTGEARTIELALTAAQPGSGEVRVSVFDASGAVLLEMAKTVQVTPDGAVRTQHDGRFIVGTDSAALKLPAQAETLGAQLVVSGARDLVTDPGFAGLAQTAPAVAAWAYVQRGQPAPAPLAAALGTWAPGSGAMSELQVACAVVAFGAAAGDGPNAELGRALKWLESARPVGWRERSAVLVALAAGATDPTAQSRNSDPVAALLHHIREESWESLSTEQGHPTVMARLAAGLLLADRRDAIGRELFERARATLVTGGRSGRLLVNEESAVDAVLGSAALAIAARQLGENTVAEELARGLAPHLHLGMRGDPEASFWLLAASAYGVFGAATPDAVEVEVNGVKHRLALAQGSTTLPLPMPESRVTVRSQLPVLLRLEASYRQAVGATSAAPLAVRIDGHTGHAGETSALELTVESAGKQSLARPIIELELPGLGMLSQEARTRLAAAGGVTQVESPDSAGIVRIHLTPLDPQKPRRLPLPIYWLGSGRVTGLAITAYNADQPGRLTTLPARQIELTPPAREGW